MPTTTTFARAVAFAISQPEDVDINEILSAELNASVRAIEIRGARLPDQVLVFSGVEAPPKQ